MDMDLYKSKYTAEDLETAIKAVLDPYEEGRNAEYLKFWEEYLNPSVGYITWGSRFAGSAWNDKTFKPPVDIVPTGSAAMMFYLSNITDLKALCDKIGIVVDFSKTPSFAQAFSDSGITHVGVIDTRAAATADYIFYRAQNLVTVDKIILKQDGSQALNNAFTSADALRDIAVEGVIGKSISFPNSSLLTSASVQSVIDHLKDLTGQTAQTVTFHNTVGNNMTAAQKAAITAKNWTLVY